MILQLQQRNKNKKQKQRNLKMTNGAVLKTILTDIHSSPKLRSRKTLRYFLLKCFFSTPNLITFKSVYKLFQEERQTHNMPSPTYKSTPSHLRTHLTTKTFSKLSYKPQARHSPRPSLDSIQSNLFSSTKVNILLNRSLLN